VSFEGVFTSIIGTEVVTGTSRMDVHFVTSDIVHCKVRGATNISKPWALRRSGILLPAARIKCSRGLPASSQMKRTAVTTNDVV
jgi:hypothetical protein